MQLKIFLFEVVRLIKEEFGIDEVVDNGEDATYFTYEEYAILIVMGFYSFLQPSYEDEKWDEEDELFSDMEEYFSNQLCPDLKHDHEELANEIKRLFEMLKDDDNYELLELLPQHAESIRREDGLVTSFNQPEVKPEEEAEEENVPAKSKKKLIVQGIILILVVLGVIAIVMH